MNELRDEDKAVLLSGILRLRLGKIILIFCIILLFYEITPPGSFNGYDPGETKSAVIVSEEISAYEPIAFNPADVKNGIHIPTGMIADTGCAEVVQNCGACHSLDLVKQNRATKKGWKDIITWMQETQKLWDLGLQEETILNYLAKNYGPEESGRRKNLGPVEWYDL